MELMVPDAGLITWTVLAIIHLALSIIVITRLSKLAIDPWLKLCWLGCILFIPLFGPVMFIAFRKAKLAGRLN